MVLGLRTIIKYYGKRVGDRSFKNRNWGLMTPKGLIYVGNGEKLGLDS